MRILWNEQVGGIPSGVMSMQHDYRESVRVH